MSHIVRGNGLEDSLKEATLFIFPWNWNTYGVSALIFSFMFFNSSRTLGRGIYFLNLACPFSLRTVV